MEKSPMRKSINDIRQEFIIEILREISYSDKKTPIVESKNAIIINGPFVGVEMKVMYIEENGTVHLKNPKTGEIIKSSIDNVFDFYDYAYAHRDALVEYPESNENKYIDMETGTYELGKDENESKYFEIKNSIKLQIDNLSDEELQFFLDNLKEEDFEIAAIVRDESVKRKDTLRNTKNY